MQRVYKENEWGKVSKRIITPLALKKKFGAQKFLAKNIDLSKID